MNTNQRVARLYLQVAMQLARDLQVFRSGSDPSRFDRMVNARGKQIIKPDDAIFVIKSITDRANVNKYYPVTCRFLGYWLVSKGVKNV